MDFQSLLYNALLTIITTGFPILIGYIVVFIRQHLSTKQLQTAQVLASNGVLFSEQVSKQLGLDNVAKYNSALASAKTLATKYGVKLSDEQWNSLIESSVGMMKKGLSDVVTPVLEATKPILIDSTPSVDTIPTVDIPTPSTPIVVAPVANSIQDQVATLITQSKVSAQNDAINQVSDTFSQIVKSVTVPVQ